VNSVDQLAPGAFFSGFIFAGKSWSHTFTVVGTFPYRSATSGFTGTIVVTDGNTGGGGGGGSSKPFAPMGPGWNLVTYGGPTGGTVQALSQLGNDWMVVYYWDGSHWRRHFRPGIAPSFLNNLGTVKTGEPLWIFTTDSIP
jgi:hypothetical protein